MRAQRSATLFVATFFMISTSVCSAQPGSVGGPMLGYVTDSTPSIRAVFGVAGASYMGPEIELPFNLWALAPAPDREAAIVLAGSDRRAFTLDMRKLALTPIEGVEAGAEEIWLSPKGESAVFAASGGRIQVVSGLWKTAVASASFVLPAVADSIAVSDDGEFVLVIAEGRLSRWTRSGGLSAAIPLTDAAAAQFFEGSRESMAASKTGLVIAIAESGDMTNVARMADAGFVAGSADGARIFVTTSEGIVALRRDGTVLSKSACECEIAGLTKWNGGVYQLSEYGSGPVWIYDPNGESPRTLFVPAAVAAKEVR